MLEMLTGSELEQAERPCCSNVLLSFNCAQCNFCVPHGHLATLASRAAICLWSLSSQGGGIENDLMSPVGDQP